MGLRTNLISLLAQAGSRRKARGKTASNATLQPGAIHDTLAPPSTPLKDAAGGVSCDFCGWRMGSPQELSESNPWFKYCPLCANVLPG